MFKRCKILVVDDEKIWRDHIKEILEKDGYNVFTADSGSSAIESIKRDKFDLIILDIRMESEFRGIEVLEYMQVNSPDTPVIMLTAHGTAQTARESIKKGAFDFIVKGSKDASNEDIREKVNRSLKGKNCF